MIFKEILRNVCYQSGIDIPEEHLRDLAILGQELKKWNRKINLTAIGSDEEIAIKHFVDTLYLKCLPARNIKLLDVGSGAGIPALPLKITRPDLEVTSVDAIGKKVHFQRHVSRLLGLSRFSAVHARIEHLYESHKGVFDMIVSRAFSDLTHFVQLVEPLLKNDGVIIAMKGPAIHGEIDEAQKVFGQRRLEISTITTYSLPNQFGERRLITIKRS